MDKIAIWVITPGGLQHASKLLKGLPESQLFISRRIAASWPLSNDLSMGDRVSVFEKLSWAMGECFREFTGHICIFSTGIAVRIIAPLLNSKVHDPAIVVMDDRACHAISLVSGHMGGANELATVVSRISGATPVITTATDVNELPSMDMIAKKLNLFIENIEAVKRINMAFLQGKKIRVIDPLNLISPNIPERFMATSPHISEHFTETEKKKGKENAIFHGDKTIDEEIMTVLCSDMEISVPRGTLILRPQSLIAGMGCNRNTSTEELMEFLVSSFKEKDLSINSLAAIATSSVKDDEKGLLLMAEILGKEIQFYDKDELNSVENIENPSEMAKKHLGVQSVCEAAAILAAHNGKLILPKIKKGNVTLAVARKEPGFL